MDMPVWISWDNFKDLSILKRVEELIACIAIESLYLFTELFFVCIYSKEDVSHLRICDGWVEEIDEGFLISDRYTIESDLDLIPALIQVLKHQWAIDKLVFVFALGSHLKLFYRHSPYFVRTCVLVVIHSSKILIDNYECLSKLYEPVPLSITLS